MAGNMAPIIPLSKQEAYRSEYTKYKIFRLHETTHLFKKEEHLQKNIKHVRSGKLDDAKSGQPSFEDGLYIIFPLLQEVCPHVKHG